MSPSGRPGSGSRRNSSGGFKPYTRGVTPIMLPPIPDGSQERHDNLERPGFPTYAQYKQVESAYLHSLTPRRQGKALISQALFDRIWDVLHQPEAQGETAQFRFWARKMFTVSKTHRVTLGVDSSSSSVDSSVDSSGDADVDADGTQEVLLHDNLLVAIQEQLYDLLCYCHGSTGHGGRDKTCALIRKHYTWVPKDLVSNFIKACPTCIMKKCGNVDGAAAAAMAQAQSQISEHQHGHHLRQEESTSQSSPFPGLRDFFQQAGMFSPNTNTVNGSCGSPSPGTDAPLSWPIMGGQADSPLAPSIPEEDPLESAYREAILRARGMKSPHGHNHSAQAQTGVSSSSSGPASAAGSVSAAAAVVASRGLQSYPMVREVSLYKGLPNGWQYRHADYASAHAEFMRTKDLPPPLPTTVEGFEGLAMHRRPRVPSIAPLWGPDKFPGYEFDEAASGAGAAGEMEMDIGVGDVSAEGGHGHGHAMDRTISSNQGDDGHSSMSLQYLLMSSSSPGGGASGQKGELDLKEEYIPHIDPMLMGFSDSGTSSRTTLSHVTQDGVKLKGEEEPGESTTSDTTHHLASSANFPSSSSSLNLKRASAPLRIDIDFPNPERAFEAMMAYRESVEDGNVTPDSPSPFAGHGHGRGRRVGSGVVGAGAGVLGMGEGECGWGLSLSLAAGNPSPASSTSSSSSGLSAFPMCSTGTTPGSSALTTPVDECVDGVAVSVAVAGAGAGAGAGDVVGDGDASSGIVVKGKDKGKGKSVVGDVGEDTLSRAIEAACGI